MRSRRLLPSFGGTVIVKTLAMNETLQMFGQYIVRSLNPGTTFFPFIFNNLAARRDDLCLACCFQLENIVIDLFVQTDRREYLHSRESPCGVKNCCCTEIPLSGSIQRIILLYLSRTFSDFGTSSSFAASTPLTVSAPRIGHVESFQQILPAAAEAQHDVTLKLGAILSQIVYVTCSVLGVYMRSFPSPNSTYFCPASFAVAPVSGLLHVGHHFDILCRTAGNRSFPVSTSTIFVNHLLVVVPLELRLRGAETGGHRVHLPRTVSNVIASALFCRHRRTAMKEAAVEPGDCRQCGQATGRGED